MALIYDYTIVGTSAGEQSLETLVRAAINDDWQPLGGVAVNEVPNDYGGDGKTYLYQAMVRYGE